VSSEELRSSPIVVNDQGLQNLRHQTGNQSSTGGCFANTTTVPVLWYAWDGTMTEQHIKEINLKWHHYDAFQNDYCPAISNSKLTCNTNISGVMLGPVGQYQFK
jgi:hypothetical protein